MLDDRTSGKIAEQVGGCGEGIACPVHVPPADCPCKSHMSFTVVKKPKAH